MAVSRGFGARQPPATPGDVFWAGYPSSLGTDLLGCAGKQSFGTLQCFLFRALVRIDYTLMFSDGLLLPWKRDPVLTNGQKPSGWAPGASTCLLVHLPPVCPIPPSPSLNVLPDSPGVMQPGLARWLPWESPLNSVNLSCFT